MNSELETLKTELEKIRFAYEHQKMMAEEHLAALARTLDERDEARAEIDRLQQYNGEAAERTKSARLMSLIRKMANSVPDKQQCEMWDLRAEAREALAEFKEESAG